ncbi:hypothetical protein QTP88_017503 [Uroleucon formosanum]
MMPRGKNGYSWELNSGTQDSEPLLERNTEDPDDVLFTSRPGTSTFVADMLSSHSHKMNNQNNQLNLISNSVKTLKNVSEDISVELDHQNIMLENLSSELDKTESRLDMVSKKVAQVLQLSDDDIVILGISQKEIEERTKRLFIASHNMGLLVNEAKTKYMVMSRQVILKNNMKIIGYSFKKVEDFKYLGVNINKKNNMHNEIKIRMCVANRSYYAMKEMFSSKLQSRRTKERLYITYLRPIATYACETWASTKGDEEKLSSFERKMLRKIYGPVYIMNSGIFKRKKNDEIQRLFNNPSICQFIHSKRIE